MARDLQLIDAHATAHKKYGATRAALYLIRPDGYVALRSRPDHGEKLREFLRTLFS